MGSGVVDVDLVFARNGLSVGLFCSAASTSLSTGKGGVLKGASVVLSLFRNEGLVLPVEEASGDESSSGFSSGSSSGSGVEIEGASIVLNLLTNEGFNSESCSCSGEASVVLNLLMNGGLDLPEVVELSEVDSGVESGFSSYSESGTASRTGASVVLNLLNNGGLGLPEVFELSEVESGIDSRLSSLSGPGTESRTDASVVLKRLNSGGLGLPEVFELSEVESGIDSGLSSLSESGTEASVVLNLLMNGLRLLFKGFAVVELTKLDSKFLISLLCSSDSGSSVTDEAEDGESGDSVLRNRLRNVGRFRVVDSEAGDVLSGGSLARIRLNSA